MLDADHGAARHSPFAASDLAGTVSASPAHSGAAHAAQPRRRRRGGGGEQQHWQCQVSRPGRVVPHQATVSVTAQGVLLQWNHIEALIGKDSLAEALLTGKDLIAPVNILAVTRERNPGRDVFADYDDYAVGQEDVLYVHVLTTPSPMSSGEGQSEYHVYKLFAFEGPVPKEAAASCRDAIKRLADAPPSLSGRRMPKRVRIGDKAGGESERFHLYFIVNPVSGHRLGEAIWNKVEPIFSAAGVPFDYTLTSHAGHVGELIGANGSVDLDSFHALVAIGGDGTVSEVPPPPSPLPFPPSPLLFPLPSSAAFSLRRAPILSLVSTCCSPLAHEARTGT